MALEVFISYAHEDERLRNELEKHLAMLKEEGIISVWYDGDIMPGEEWEAAIIRHLNRAQMILLLISTNFLNSPFSRTREMSRALERHESREAVVIPIILRPCDWERTPFGRLQALPKDAKPVMKWRVRDDAFLSVAEGIRAAAKSAYRSAREAEPSRSPRDLTLQPPYEHFMGRALEMKSLAQRLLSRKGVAVSAAVQGMGGMGKTELARKLAWEIKDRFRGHAVWIEVGPQAKRDDLTERLALKLGVDLRGKRDLDRRAAAVRENLSSEGPLLAVLDGVWDRDVGEWVARSLLPPERALLVTSRDAQVCVELAGEPTRLGALSEKEALALLGELLGNLGAYRPAAVQVIESCGRLPLALRLAASLCYGQAANLPSVAQRLAGQPARGIAGGVERCLALSYERLDEDGRRRFRTLGAFAPAPASLSALAAVWGDNDRDVAQEAAARLEGLSLVERRIDVGQQRNLQAGENAGEQADESPAAPPDSGASDDIIYSQQILLNTYSFTLLCGVGEEHGTAKRHSDYYADLTRQERWQEAERYWPQFDHAWRRMLAAGTGRALQFYYEVRGYLGRRPGRAAEMAWIEELLKRQDLAPRDQGELLNTLGCIHDYLGNRQRALRYMQRSLEIWRKEDPNVEERKGEARALHDIGSVYNALGDRTKALSYYGQALEIRREVGDPKGEARNLTDIAYVCDALGDRERALEHLNRALPLQVDSGDRKGEAATLNNIGTLYDHLGNPREALPYLEQALKIRRQVWYPAGVAQTLSDMGLVYDHLGNRSKALQFYQQALPIRRAIGDRAGEASTLYNMGVMYDNLGNREEARHYLEQALPLRRDVGDREGESATLFCMARIHEAEGATAEAEGLLAQVIAIDEAIGSPELENHRAELARVRAKQNGDRLSDAGA